MYIYIYKLNYIYIYTYSSWAQNTFSTTLLCAQGHCEGEIENGPYKSTKKLHSLALRIFQIKKYCNNQSS